ncbi:hypothetical protein CEXT_720521 [Caerostris extrusa]|uniref:Uncharacterized protein n=1 Tax=Caerostris extrusa TaxID=172846 RepID=A0AAV4UXH0_CAEEX|nr:hypothetical protein CEXT_720521 [Caerostris extrusa]
MSKLNEENVFMDIWDQTKRRVYAVVSISRLQNHIIGVLQKLFELNARAGDGTFGSMLPEKRTACAQDVPKYSETMHERKLIAVLIISKLNKQFVH